MISHTSERPDLELQEALAYLDVLDDMVASGAVTASPWYANTREFLEEILDACLASSSEDELDGENDDSEEVESDEEREEIEASAGPDDVDAHVTEEQG